MRGGVDPLKGFHFKHFLAGERRLILPLHQDYQAEHTNIITLLDVFPVHLSGDPKLFCPGGVLLPLKFPLLLSRR